MRKILLFLTCFVALHGFEFEPQFENNQVSVIKFKMFPHEEIPAHRDAVPRLVIALKGGTITRIEEDGSENEVVFPTGTTVYLGIDPPDELHRGVNRSDEEIELMIIQLKTAPTFIEKEEGTTDIKVEINLNCPLSEELQSFMQSIPSESDHAVELDDWQTSFINNMNALINLVQTGQFNQAFWSVVTDNSSASPQEE